MILVAGEALMDVIAGPDDELIARPGGAPFNVARAIAALGGECTFLGRLSDDRFGARLRLALAEADVDLALTEPSHDPTPLALAELDDHGSAQYRFYHEHTAAADVGTAAALDELANRADALVFGGVALTLEPFSSTLLSLLARVPRDLLVICDPNCRPGAIANHTAYRQRLRSFLRRADLVKVSTEDLQVLFPDHTPHAAAELLARLGPSAVVVTDGSRPVRVITTEDEREIPVPEVEVVDTIGAGDAFVAALVTWWTAAGCSRDDLRSIGQLTAAASVAATVAARACEVPGAGLPPGVMPHLPV